MLSELTPIDSQSTQIWNDRSYKTNEATFNDNLLVGKCGYFSFDNDIYKNTEDRFRSNLDRRKRQVADNALRAREVLQIDSNDTLY